MKSWNTARGGSVIRVLSGGIHAFLLTNGEQNILIDTGMTRHRRLLERRLRRLGIQKIALLVLTHAHYDHAGNAAMIKERYGATVIIHRTEADHLASAENTPIHGTVALTKFLFNLLRTRFPRWLSYPPCRADVLVDDRYDLRDAGFSAYLLHTPGHSPGSISVIIGDEIALVGDALFGVSPRSVLPPIASDTAKVIQSWKELLGTGCRIFMPAHGRAVKRKLLVKNLRRHSGSGSSSPDPKQPT